MQPPPGCAPVAVTAACSNIPRAPTEAEPTKSSPAHVEPPPAAPLKAWRVDAGPWLDVGLGPRVMTGVKVAVGFWSGRWSLTGELRWDPPASATVVNYGYGAFASKNTLLTGGIIGCWHGAPLARASFAVCGIGELGQLQVQSPTDAELLGLPSPATLYLGAGAGGDVEVLLLGRFYAHGAANLLGARKLPNGTTSGSAGVPSGTGAIWGPTVGFGVGVGARF